MKDLKNSNKTVFKLNDDQVLKFAKKIDLFTKLDYKIVFEEYSKLSIKRSLNNLKNDVIRKKINAVRKVIRVIIINSIKAEMNLKTKDFPLPKWVSNKLDSRIDLFINAFVNSTPEEFKK